MAVDDKFAEAWLNADHRIFGLKLKPFSGWHRFVLSSINSPLIQEESEVNAAAVYAACLICSQDYPNADVKLGITVYLRMVLYRKKPEKVMHKFVTYINDYASYPEFWDKEEKKSSKTNGTPPEPLATITSLMGLGFTEKESWDMPCGKASWYSAAYAQNQGADIDFITQDEKEMQEEWKDIEKNLGEKEEEFLKDFNPDLGTGASFTHVTDGRP